MQQEYLVNHPIPGAEVGKTVALNDKQAANWLADGSITPVPAKPKKTKAKVQTSIDNNSENDAS